MDRFFADHDARRTAGEPGLHEPARTAAHTELCAGKSFALRESSELVGSSELEPLRAATVHSCCAACAADPHCAGFTFSADSFHCSLKSWPGSHSPLRGVVAGVLARPGALGDSDATPGRGRQQQRQQQQQEQAGQRHGQQAAQRERFKARLTEIFMDHDPSKVVKVDALLDRYRGNEERFLQRTEEQYHAIERLVQERKDDRGALAAGFGSVVGPARDAHGFTAGEYRERVEQLLRVNDPSRLAQVDAMLEHFAGRELELVDFLIGRYQYRGGKLT
jgi:hypothetical protein